MEFKGTNSAKCAKQNERANDSYSLNSQNSKMMMSEEMNTADKLQAEIYNAGVELVNKVAVISEKENTEITSNVIDRLTRLKDFSYNICFIGGQSSGKSTVINALLEYPLMPTCMLTTTCVGTHIFYGEKTRISVIDDNTNKRVMNIDCGQISEQQFNKLKEYACAATNYKKIETLQHFTDVNIFGKEKIEPSALVMDRNNPNHVVILLMTLLTVYVDQNTSREDAPEDIERILSKRESILRYFGFPADTVNYTIKLQWNGDFLKNGMTITDLPGLGAFAPDKKLENGKEINGHEKISTNAIKNESTDAMVFLIDPKVTGEAADAVKEMISNAKLKAVVDSDDLIIPVMNKVDLVKGEGELEASLRAFQTMMRECGVDKEIKDIRLCSSKFGEYKYNNITIDRTIFYREKFDETYEDLSEDEMYGQETDEIIQEVKAKLEKKLRVRYVKHSGLESLKEFFRTSYLTKGKYGKSFDTLFALREYVNYNYAPLRSMAQDYSFLKDLGGEIISIVSKSFSSQADKTLSEALIRITENDDEAKKNEIVIQQRIDKMPDFYFQALNNALTEYKSKNLKIADEFELRFLGLGSKARLDKPENSAIYDKLLNGLRRFPVDITRINKEYSEILDFASKEINKVYSFALTVLSEIDSKYRSKIDDAIDSLNVKGEKLSDEYISPINQLKESIVHYLGTKADIIASRAKADQADLTKVGKEVAAQIISLNSETVSNVSKQVLSQVDNKIETGIFNTKKKLLPIDGDDGVKNVLNNLYISESSLKAIKNNIITVGIESIKNNVNTWYVEANNNIQLMLETLKIDINTMINDTCEGLSGSAQENEAKHKIICDKIIELESVMEEFKASVQPTLKAAIDDSGNAHMKELRDDLFCKIV